MRGDRFTTHTYDSRDTIKQTIRDAIERLFVEDESSRAIEEIFDALRAAECVDFGWMPFSYQYYFEDRKGDECGPMRGIIWAKDADEARRNTAIDVSGGQYGYNITIIPNLWRES